MNEMGFQYDIAGSEDFIVMECVCGHKNHYAINNGYYECVVNEGIRFIQVTERHSFLGMTLFACPTCGTVKATFARIR